MSTARDAHAKLVRELAAHNYRYYVLDDPAVTDAAFDALLRDLRALEAAHPELVSPSSPTQRVGGEARSQVAKVKRKTKMFSLDNAYSQADLGEFLRRVRDGSAGAAAACSSSRRALPQSRRSAKTMPTAATTAAS